MNSVLEICAIAKKQTSYVQNLTTDEKNFLLCEIADAIVKNADFILQANAEDLHNNQDKPEHILDRLRLTKERIKAIAEGLTELVKLDDPVGEVLENHTANSGINITKIRVPFGVVGIIYEARPNVTIDVIGLCLKAGNCVVLRGSRDALNSNKALVGAVKTRISSLGFTPDFIQLVEDASREGAETLMNARGLLDVLIPRGSAGLIKSVVEKSTVPVIETGTGNCHAYVHEAADFSMAEDIIINGKMQRPSVCNALENILVDEKIADKFLGEFLPRLKSLGVEIVGCEKSKAIFPDCTLATEEDYFTEFLALKISVKVVSGLREAIARINKYGTSHSEVIITSDNEAAQTFLNDVDCACVYFNASTRFTDGFEFGLGAEMGISTQKMHVRGPIGLKELTSMKYKITGNGQIRK